MSSLYKWLWHIFRSTRPLRVNFYDSYVIVIDQPLRKQAYLDMQQTIQIALQGSIETSGRLFGCVGDRTLPFKEEK